jgi:hypothetical protein
LPRVINGSIDIGAVEVQAVPTHFLLYLPGANTVALTNQPTTITVIAVDANNNTVPAYQGTVPLTGPDGLAVSYTFTAADQGVHAFPVTLRTPGHQTLQATDAADSLMGSMTVSVLTDVSSSVTVSNTGFGAGRVLRITNISSAALTGPFQVVLVGLRPYVELDGASLITPTGGTIPLDFSATVNGNPAITVPQSVLASLASGSSFRLSVGAFSTIPRMPVSFGVMTLVGDL